MLAAGSWTPLLPGSLCPKVTMMCSTRVTEAGRPAACTPLTAKGAAREHAALWLHPYHHLFNMPVTTRYSRASPSVLGLSVHRQTRRCIHLPSPLLCPCMARPRPGHHFPLPRRGRLPPGLPDP